MRIEVFPCFSIYIHLQEFYVVDLVRGYYQVRINLKPCTYFEYDLRQHSSSSIDDSSFVNNFTAISRTIKVAYKDQYYNLDSAFKCRANSTKRIDRCGTTFILPLELELYHMSFDTMGTLEENNDFRLVSRRQVDVQLTIDKSTHCHRSIFFEFFSFSMVSITIHASLVGGRIERRKQLPDPPITDKLRHFHGFVCHKFISSLLSLQEFMQRYSYVLTSPLTIASIDGADEEQSLRSELDASNAPWLMLQRHVEILGKRLTELFCQFLQLFARSKDLYDVMLQEFEQQRLKQMSEAFFFTEEAVQQLLSSSTAVKNYQAVASVLDLVKRCDYLQLVPRLSVYVTDVDANVNDFTVIMEQRFLPSCLSAGVVTNADTALFFGASDITRIPQIFLTTATEGGDGSATARMERHDEKPSCSGSWSERTRHKRAISDSQQKANNLEAVSCPPSAPLNQINDVCQHQFDEASTSRRRGTKLSLEALSKGVISKHYQKEQRKKSAPVVSNGECSSMTGEHFLRRKLFEFCLPLGGGRRSQKSILSNTSIQYEEISPNSLLLKGGNFKQADETFAIKSGKWYRRRMTDPGSSVQAPTDCISSVNINELNLNYIENDIDSDGNDNIGGKSHSLNEIPPNFEETDRRKRQSKNKNASSSTSKLVVEEGPSLSRNLTNDGCNKSTSTIVDEALIEFVKQKEFFKQQLRAVAAASHNYLLYSDTIRSMTRDNSHCPTYFSLAAKNAANERLQQHNTANDNVHLVIFVHGLEGSCEDLTAYRNYLRIALPDCNLAFLLSANNQHETWSNLGKMAENLLSEIFEFIQQMPIEPTRISFVAHSLGGVIVRAMCGLSGMSSLVDKLYTLMTLSSPHCGLIFNQRTASWGISILQWWKQSACLGQLTMRDAADIRDTFLYRLSMNGAFGMFRNVLLVGSMQDLYVPGHSALVEPCKASIANDTNTANAYAEMLANINESIVASSRHTTLIKYTVAHAIGNVSRAQQVTGRAVHIAAVDDDTFVEKLISVSASKYFR